MSGKGAPELTVKNCGDLRVAVIAAQWHQQVMLTPFEPADSLLAQQLKTLLFADIRGFTTISEQFKDDPQGLTHLINRFLTPMTDVILVLVVLLMSFTLLARLRRTGDRA